MSGENQKESSNGKVVPKLPLVEPCNDLQVANHPAKPESDCEDHDHYHHHHSTSEVPETLD